VSRASRHTVGMDIRSLRATPDEPIEVVTPGVVPYIEAWDTQKRLAEARTRDEIPDTVLLLEHPPVYTLGRRADEGHIVLPVAERQARGITIEQIDRGGDVTYHGPGQLVGYPIMKLSGPRVVDHVRALEDMGTRVAASFGVDGERLDGFSGVWVGTEKLMAIGVHVSAGWVTTHGFAFNVDPVMADFAGIVACGIADKGVCSLATLGVPATMDMVIDATLDAIGHVWDAKLVRAPEPAVVTS